MNKENFKEMMIQLLNNEKHTYEDLSKMIKNNVPYKEMVTAIERIIKHVDSGFYDVQIEAFCKYIEDETLKETDEIIEKSKKKGKKKAE